MSFKQIVDDTDARISDRQLVERVRRGETVAFDVLVRRHYRTAYVVAVSLLSNGMDAEDVCQDAFLKALERIEDCRHADRFASWLLQIVRNRAHNFRDYRRVRTGVDVEITTHPSAADSAQDAERSELRRRLEAALGELSELQRQVVLRHDLEGWKHREIAESLELSEGMSRQHLFTARKKLRELLGVSLLKEHLDD